MLLGMTWATFGFALLLFFLRVINYSISTIRLIFIARDLRSLAAITAFLEALIFAVVMSQVLKDIGFLPNLIAYCLGAAVGSYLGQWIEARVITSYSTAVIISREEYGQAIAEAIRQRGFAATISRGEGRDGNVVLIRTTANSRHMQYLIATVHQVNPQAFVDVEAIRSIHQGWIPSLPLNLETEEKG